MSNIAIMRPWPTLTPAAPTDASLLTTGDPKEAYVGTQNTTFNLTWDTGAQQLINGVYLGFTNLPVGAKFDAYCYTLADRSDTSGAFIGSATMVKPSDPSFPVHGFATGVGRIARYVTATITPGGIFPTIGVAAAGFVFTPTYNPEWGAGRGLTDTGTVARLLSGGFAADKGVVVPWYSWTLGDLTDAEVDTLYAIARATGETNSVLVVENPDQTAGINERIHWGLFDKIDAYERLAPGATKWALRINDWA